MKEITLLVHENEHIAPHDKLTYNRGFVDLNQCEECKYTGEKEVLHEADSCSNCGGKVNRLGPGMWDIVEQQWLIKK